MKFLTEDDLRNIEKKEGLHNFKLKDGMKLTPSARGYLIDKGFRFNNKNKVKTDLLKINDDIENKQKLLEAEFLKTSQSLLEYNKLIAKEIYDYSKYIKTINLEDKEKFDCKIYLQNECYEKKNIDIEFNDLQSSNGKIVVELYYIKSLLKNNLNIFKEEETHTVKGILYRLSEILDLILGG